jgi:nucleotide-binding universal stress UspA family protein
MRTAASAARWHRQQGCPRQANLDKEKAMKILLAADGSDYTKRMLAYVAAHDEWLGPRHEYTVLTVVPALPPHAARFLSRADCDGYYADEADKVLKPVRAFAAQQGWRAEFTHLVGPAAESIADYARSHRFDLLMMGSHGHSALGNMVMGSVATGVLARCTVPALLIR